MLQHLAAAAASAGLHDEAARWSGKLVPLIDPDTDSMAKQHVVAARLLTSQLRQVGVNDDNNDNDGDNKLYTMAQSLLDQLHGPLNGSSAELDDLLATMSTLRTAAIRLLSCTSCPVLSCLVCSALVVCARAFECRPCDGDGEGGPPWARACDWCCNRVWSQDAFCAAGTWPRAQPLTR